MSIWKYLAVTVVLKIFGNRITCLSMTIMPSKTLNPLEMYLKGPSEIILSSISTANTAEKTMLLISTITVSSSGWLWYSMPIDKVFIRIATKIPEKNWESQLQNHILPMYLFTARRHLISNSPCWKYLWLTRVLTYFLSHDNNLDTRLQMVEQALENRLFLFSFAIASAVISSTQHEKSSISTFYNQRSLSK